MCDSEAALVRKLRAGLGKIDVLLGKNAVGILDEGYKVELEGASNIDIYGKAALRHMKRVLYEGA